MTEEEQRREREEADHLQHQIHRVIAQIHATESENIRLEAEVSNVVREVTTLILQCEQLDQAVNARIGELSKTVGTAQVKTEAVFEALNELTIQYFTFKNLSLATKKLTEYQDEYYSKFSFHHELRRITLGYIIGLDLHIISGEKARQKVEHAYLQNSDYWLTYCITSVMLWASDEREAAERSMRTSLSKDYLKACLFYLLVNLRFNRVDAAKQWYLHYLERTGEQEIGDDWKYLLQAYLCGAFGADEVFEREVSLKFEDMMKHVHATTVDYALQYTDKAKSFAWIYAHKTGQEYPLLKRLCTEYDEMKQLLSHAEKNALLASAYHALAEAEVADADTLPQRIENVLYSLVSDYDDDEREVVQKIRYNEAVIQAKGDVALAQAQHNALYAATRPNETLGDKVLQWAFADDVFQTDLSVQQFSISFMKEPIAEGYGQFAEQYRKDEQKEYTFTIDGHSILCGEDDFAGAKRRLEQQCEGQKWKTVLQDRFVLLNSCLLLVSALLLVVLSVYFNPVLLTLAILTALASSFLLWRRLAELEKLLKERKRKNALLLRKALDELKRWRSDYKEADAINTDLQQAVSAF